jgi:FkbM family methyltransferase
MSITTNIIKGVYKRLKRKTASERFKRLSWARIKLLKHEDDTSVKQLNINGQVILYKKPYEFMHTYQEIYEKEIYRFVSDKPKPLIIDCGANIGMSVLYFKAIYPNAMIIAYEPDEDNFDMLQRNIECNNLKDITAVKAAVWKEDTTLEFSSGGSQGSKIRNGIADEQNIVKVKAIRLAEMISNNEVDFLKIDIEGAEDVVIHDCAPYLDKVKNLFLEYHGTTQETGKLSSILDLMHKSSFKTYIKMAADDLEYPFEKKHTGHSFDVQLNLFCYR